MLSYRSGSKALHVKNFDVPPSKRTKRTFPCDERHACFSETNPERTLLDISAPENSLAYKDIGCIKSSITVANMMVKDVYFVQVCNSSVFQLNYEPKVRVDSHYREAEERIRVEEVNFGRDESCMVVALPSKGYVSTLSMKCEFYHPHHNVFQFVWRDRLEGKNYSSLLVFDGADIYQSSGQIDPLIENLTSVKVEEGGDLHLSKQVFLGDKMKLCVRECFFY